MKIRSLSKCAVLAAALALTASVARADQCDDILGALRQEADTLMKKEPKGAALCAGMGQLIGILRSAGIVAAQCLQGEKRDAVVKDMAESIKAMEEGVSAQCKNE